jgi:multidrug efflux pump subunit AcrA (membrane-fusion protein)
MRRAILFSLLTSCLLILPACGTKSGNGSETANLIVVNAPVAGEVRRVLVSENIAVDENAPIVEIAVRNAPSDPAARKAPLPPAENPRNEINEAQKEVERASVEVSRVEQLVASKAAPQSQLDAARADYQKAQEHLQQLQKKASTRSPVNTEPVGNQPLDSQSGEKSVLVRVPAAGVVRVISVKRGQTVSAGQPLATISPGN